MKKILRKILRGTIGTAYKQHILKRKVKYYCRIRPQIEKRIKGKESVKVVFFAMNVGMWKCDGLFKLLLQDKRFEPLAVSLLIPQDGEDYRRYVQDSMKSFFSEKGYPFLESYNFETGEWLDIKQIEPDIVFYTQPYDAGFEQYRIKSLWDKCLFLYIPYCYQMELIRGYHNLLLQNIAWRMFYPTLFHKQLGENNALNKGENIVVTGLSMADDLICDKRTEWKGWKQKDDIIKRVIWAPHHSIKEDSTLHCSNFIELSDSLLKLTKEYIGKIQFAFKPHPRLITQLYQNPEWGEERTNAYYQKWREMPNTIFVEGDYTDLFKSSDAMVHDCSTFMGEYLYTNRPVMFIAKEHVTDIMNDFGKSCYNQHYIGHNIDDIRKFLDEVVLGGKDPMKEQRFKFFEDQLLPPNGRTAAENMYNEMLKLFE